LKSFHDLTPIGQAQRLRPHATRILETCGVRAVRLRQLTAASNIIFRVDAQGGRRLILRITSPKSAHSIENVRSEVS
jgi:Ser/Thr protein kinase RdoA (MazF antagonist)